MILSLQTRSMMAENLRNSGAILCYILQALEKYYETKVRLRLVCIKYDRILI